MKTIFAKAFLFLTVFLAPALQAEYLPSKLFFIGSFESTYSTTPECDGIFNEMHYSASHHLVGSNRRTSVVHLEDANGVGFFHPITMTGLLGYQNDFIVTRDLRKEGFDYRVEARGMVSVDLLVMDVYVQKTPIGKSNILCEASGTFSAFH